MYRTAIGQITGGRLAATGAPVVEARRVPLRRGVTSIVHLEGRSGRDVRLQPLDPGRGLGLP